MYPLSTLVQAGIREISIVTGKNTPVDFKVAGISKDYGCKLFIKQDAAGGMHSAGLESLQMSKHCRYSGDNIFEASFKDAAVTFEGQKGARIFLKKTKEAYRFGVAELDRDNNVVNIEEKPKQPKTSYAVTGCYFYDARVFEIIKTLKPSARGELEITDVNNDYIKKGLMEAHFIDGHWTDAGTFESLFKANRIARSLALRQSDRFFTKKDCREILNADAK